MYKRQDYKRFRKLVKTGQLYEYIQKVYWAETGVQITRAEAKKLMFTVAFSSYRYCPEGKQVLRKYLPSIVAVIDGFKKARIKELATGELSPALSCEERENKATAQEARDRGNASFAIMLQQVESVVFVDKILAECHLRRLKVLSKHDSIICRQSDKRLVTGIICRIMNQIFGKATYSLDVDGEVFKIPKKRKSRLGRVSTEVVHTLFGLSHQANAPPTSPRAIVNEEWSMEHEIGVLETCRGTELATSTLSKDVERSNTVGSTTLLDDKIKSQRVRRLRDRIMGRE